MAKTLSIKNAKILYEDNLDRWRQPTSKGGSTEFTVQRVSTASGKVIRTITKSIRKAKER